MALLDDVNLSNHISRDRGAEAQEIDPRWQLPAALIASLQAEHLLARQGGPDQGCDSTTGSIEDLQRPVAPIGVGA